MNGLILLFLLPFVNIYIRCVKIFEQIIQGHKAPEIKQ